LGAFSFHWSRRVIERREVSFKFYDEGSRRKLSNTNPVPTHGGTLIRKLRPVQSMDRIAPFEYVLLESDWDTHSEA
jgi:hypothetical protein